MPGPGIWGAGSIPLVRWARLPLDDKLAGGGQPQGAEGMGGGEAEAAVEIAPILTFEVPEIRARAAVIPVVTQPEPEAKPILPVPPIPEPEIAPAILEEAAPIEAEPIAPVIIPEPVTEAWAEPPVETREAYEPLAIEEMIAAVEEAAPPAVGRLQATVQRIGDAFRQAGIAVADAARHAYSSVRRALRL